MSDEPTSDNERRKRRCERRTAAYCSARLMLARPGFLGTLREGLALLDEARALDLHDLDTPSGLYGDGIVEGTGGEDGRPDAYLPPPRPQRLHHGRAGTGARHDGTGDIPAPERPEKPGVITTCRRGRYVLHQLDVTVVARRGSDFLEGILR